MTASEVSQVAVAKKAPPIKTKKGKASKLPDKTVPKAAPRLLRRAEVLQIVGVSFPTLWAWMRAGRFPRARITGGGASGRSKSVWLSNEVEEWLSALPIRRLKGDRT
jgi:predicted DNA-binding transcriptional regulator AlpA